MTWGTLTAGRLTLREGYTSTATDNTGLTVKGQESSPPLTATQLEQRREDLQGLTGAVLPVTWTSKARLNGFYLVTSAKADYTHYQDAGVLTLDWTLELDRYGTEFETDHESRLSGPLTRNTSHAATGERWLAPPLGHYGFWSASTTLSVVTRTGADGALIVYRGIPLATSPRWGAAPTAALAGRVRFLDADGAERSGLNFSPAATGWELTNGLVSVKVNGPGQLDVRAWTGGAWRSKLWTINDGTGLGLPASATLLRNDLGNVIVRLLWAGATTGRLTLDITLRRGARFAELYFRRNASATLSLARSATEAATAGTGYLRATANDADGNRYVLGSAQAFTGDVVNGGISKAATTTLDAFIGVAAAGSTAVAGDQPDNLRDQYLGSPSELVVPVRR